MSKITKNNRVLNFFESKTLNCFFLLTLFGFSQAQSSEDISITGFINAGVAETNQTVTTSDGLRDMPNYTALSSFGLIGTRQLNEQWDAAIQLIARGSEDNNMATEVEWGMVNFRPTSSWVIRAGKQKFPFWITSEHINIGVLYPWIRPPVEVYDLMPITAFIGLSTEYSFYNLGPGNLTVEVFGGGAGSKIQTNTYPIELKDASGHGITASYKIGLSQIRATYVKAYLKDGILKAEGVAALALTPTVGYPQTIRFGHAEIFSAGLDVDWEDFMLRYEFAYRNTEAVQYKRRQGEYATFGRYFINRSFMPHLSYARTLKNDASGTVVTTTVVAGTQDTVKAGLNYFFNTDVVLKGEYERTWVKEGKDTFNGVPHNYVETYAMALSAVF